MSQFSRYATEQTKTEIANATYKGDTNSYRVLHMGRVRPNVVKIMIVSGPDDGIPVGSTISVPAYKVERDSK